MVGHVDAGLAEALRVGLSLRRERIVNRGGDHGRGSPSTVAARRGAASGL